MKLIKVIMVAVSFLFGFEASAQNEFEPMIDEVTFTESDLTGFWDQKKITPDEINVGFIIDGGTALSDLGDQVSCNVSFVMHSTEKTPVLSTFLKKLTKKELEGSNPSIPFNFGLQDFDQSEAENLMITSICGLNNLELKNEERALSNTWDVYRFNPVKQCFHGSVGISLDVVSDKDIYVLFYRFSNYTYATEKMVKGRNLIFPNCE